MYIYTILDSTQEDEFIFLTLFFQHLFLSLGRRNGYVRSRNPRNGS